MRGLDGGVLAGGLFFFLHEAGDQAVGDDRADHHEGDPQTPLVQESLHGGPGPSAARPLSGDDGMALAARGPCRSNSIGSSPIFLEKSGRIARRFLDGQARLPRVALGQPGMPRVEDDPGSIGKPPPATTPGPLHEPTRLALASIGPKIGFVPTRSLGSFRLDLPHLTKLAQSAVTASLDPGRGGPPSPGRGHSGVLVPWEGPDSPRIVKVARSMRRGGRRPRREAGPKACLKFGQAQA